MRSKNFTMGVDKYYFTIKSGQQNITIFRKSKQSASEAFTNYQKLGKDCEWHGKWTGKKFTETIEPSDE